MRANPGRMEQGVLELLVARAAEGLYRVIDAAYERRSVARSSNFTPPPWTRSGRRTSPPHWWTG